MDEYFKLALQKFKNTDGLVAQHGQSERLLSVRSRVRIPPGPLFLKIVQKMDPLLTFVAILPPCSSSLISRVFLLEPSRLAKNKKFQNRIDVFTIN